MLEKNLNTPWDFGCSVNTLRNRYCKMKKEPGRSLRFLRLTINFSKGGRKLIIIILAR